MVDDYSGYRDRSRSSISPICVENLEKRDPYHARRHRRLGIFLDPLLRRGKRTMVSVFTEYACLHPRWPGSFYSQSNRSLCLVFSGEEASQNEQELARGPKATDQKSS